MTTNVYDPAVIQHEFTRKALRFFYEDIPEGEYDSSEDDLREYAATINEGFGYDLDKQIAALTAERTQLRAESDGLRALVGRVVDGLPHTNYYQYYGDIELRQLLKDCQEALK